MTARTGRRTLAGLLGAALASPAALAGTSHPDAEIIALCAQHNRNREAWSAHGDDDDDCPFWAEYERTRDAIAEAKPRTIEGMVAKARAAVEESLNPDGTEAPAGCPAADWAWDLVHDLIRLHGRA